MSKKSKSAREMTITLGELFGDKLPDDLNQAAEAMASHMEAADKMDLQTARRFVWQLHFAMWTRLLREAEHSLSSGPRGPRLPANVTFGDLFPHLVVARKAQSEAPSFDAWVREHPWPRGMRVSPSTARTWLRKYGAQIAEYNDLAERSKRSVLKAIAAAKPRV